MELIEYFHIIKKRIWLIALCVTIAVVTTILYIHYYIHPIYQASTKLIVNKIDQSNPNGKKQMDFAAIGTNIKLIDTYKEIINTPAILDKVIQLHPEFHLTEEELNKIISVQSFNGTQIMSVTAFDYSHEKAMDIANTVATVFKREIPKIMNVDNVTILNMAQAQDNLKPINQHFKQYVIISFAISLLFAIGLSFLLEYLDDTLKTDADVREALDIPILSAVNKIEKEQMKLARKATNPNKVGESYVTAKQ